MESTVTPEDWEAAVLDRSLTRRRKFRRLEPTEIEELRSQ